MGCHFITCYLDSHSKCWTLLSALVKFSKGRPHSLYCNDQWKVLSLILCVHLLPPVANNKHGLWKAKLFKNCHYSLYQWTGPSTIHLLLCNAYCISSQHHWSARATTPQPITKCCSSCFSLFHHWRCQLLTSTPASLYMLSKHMWIHFGYSPQQQRTQAMLIVLNSHQYLLFSNQLDICHQSN